MIQIGIIENNNSLRYNLQQFFNKQEGMKCTIAVANTDTFFQKASPRDCFHILLQSTDNQLAVNFKNISKVKNCFPKTEIITYSQKEDTDSILKALYAGATGYLTKETPLSKIKEAIIETYKGSSAISPNIARKLVEYFSPKPTMKLLTKKENQIVQCLTDGLSYKLVADKLSISINTMNYHIKNIYRKLKVNSKSEVVAMRLRGEC